MLKGSHSFEEEELSLRKFVAAVSDRGECRGQRKGGTLHQSFANRRANRPPVARHGERPNEIPCVVRINQEKWCVVPSPDGVCGGGEGGGAGKGGGARERSNQEIGAGEAAKCSVKRGVVEPCVWDPFTSELIREGEVRLNAAALHDEGGECGREPCNRWVRWAGDEEDPHGGDDGILA